MTKELAMQILGLEKEFTFKELMEAYHREKNKYENHFHTYKTEYPPELNDVENAYKYLKQNQCYVIPTTDKTTARISYDEDEPLYYLERKNEEIKQEINRFMENFALEKKKFIERISIYLEIPNATYSDKKQEQIDFLNPQYPCFLEALQNAVKVEVERILPLIKDCQDYNDFAKFKEIVENFKTYIKEIYKKIIEEVLKEYNLVKWDLSNIYNNLFPSIKTRYHNLIEVYNLVHNYVVQAGLVSNNNTFERTCREIFNHWIINAKHSKHFREISGQEFLSMRKQVKDKIKSLYGEYLSLDIAFQNGLQKLFIEFLDNLEREKTAMYAEFYDVLEEKRKTYRNEPGIGYIGDEVWRKIRERIVFQYGKEFTKGADSYPVITPSVRKGIEQIIEEEQDEIVKLYNKRFYQIKYLLDHYPTFANSDFVNEELRTQVYPFERFIRNETYEKEFFRILNECEPNAHITNFDSIPYEDESISDEMLHTLQKEEDDILPNQNTYLVYDGCEITWLEIEEKLKQYQRKGDTTHAIYQDGILFAKNGTFNSDYLEPHSYASGIYVSDFIEEQKQAILAYPINGEVKSVTSIFEYILDRLRNLQEFDAVADYTLISFNLNSHNLFIFSHHLPVYVGFTNKNEKMYSNNPCLLRHFCNQVYQIPDESYLFNGNIEPRKKGFDLLVRRYHNY